MSALFSQLPNGGGISVALAPVDLSAAAANSLWASIRNVNKSLFLLVFLRAGTAGDNITINLQQATDAAGAGAKAMSIREVFFKRGAPTFVTAPNTNDKFQRSPSTPVNRETAISSYASATDRGAATNDFMALIRISPADVDLVNNFSYIRAQFTDPGSNAQLGCAFWIPDGAAYLGDSAPSILA